MPAVFQIPDETLVRVTERSVCGDPAIDVEAATPYLEYKVYSYCPPGEGDDPTGRDYYLLDDEGSIGGAAWAYPEHVVIVKTREQLEARKIPTIEEASKIVLHALMSSFTRGADFREGEVSGTGDDSTVELGGQTEDGLKFGMRVSVVEIWQED